MTAIHKNARQDKRALWNDSPELRESVRETLQEWGDAVKGGFPPLGYPQKTPFTVSPERAGRTYDMDSVEAVSDTIMLWNMIQRDEPDSDRRANILRLLMVLRVNFIMPEVPQEAKAKKFKMSRTHFTRLVNEAMFRFWVLHW